MKKEAYRKEGTLRPVGPGGVEMTVPKIIVDKVAREEGQTFEQFIKTHKVIHLFNNFTDFHAAYRFERIPEKETISLDEDEVEELNEPSEPKKEESKPHSFDELKKMIRR